MIKVKQLIKELETIANDYGDMPVVMADMIDVVYPVVIEYGDGHVCIITDQEEEDN